MYSQSLTLPVSGHFARFWSLQVLRKFKGFSFELLNVRQPLLKYSRLLLHLSDLVLDGQEVGIERS